MLTKQGKNKTLNLKAIMRKCYVQYVCLFGLKGNMAVTTVDFQCLAHTVLHDTNMCLPLRKRSFRKWKRQGVLYSSPRSLSPSVLLFTSLSTFPNGRFQPMGARWYLCFSDIYVTFCQLIHACGSKAAECFFSLSRTSMSASIFTRGVQKCQTRIYCDAFS